MTRAKSKQQKDKQRLINYLTETNLDQLCVVEPSYKLRKWIVAKHYHDGLNRHVIQIIGHCVLCGFNNKEALEIHHIDGNHNNNAWNNITILCANCHVLVTKGIINYCQELSQKR